MRVLQFIERTLTNFYCYDPSNNIIVAAMLLHKTETSIRSATASINLGDSGDVFSSDDIYSEDTVLERYITNTLKGEPGKYSGSEIERHDLGKQSYYMSLVVHRDTYQEKGQYLISWGNRLDDLIDKLLKDYSLPLLKEWGQYLYDELFQRGYLTKINIWFDSDDESTVSQLGKVEPYKLIMSEEQLREVVTKGLATKAIKICEEEQRPLNLDTLDSYFKEFGKTAVQNLLKMIKPLTDRISKVDCLFKKKKHFPKQGVIVNAFSKLLEKDNWGIINAGMGCGKSFMAASINEINTQNKIKKQSGKVISLSELTKKSSYRCIVMAPGHLLLKWESEILTEIPLATVTILTELHQIVKLTETERSLPKGKEFYIVSKDFCKLDYQRKPGVTQYKRKKVTYSECGRCGDKTYSLEDFYQNRGICSKCSPCNNDTTPTLVLHKSYHSEMGWICPHCGELVYSYSARKFNVDDDFSSIPLGMHEFDGEKEANSKCRHCGGDLWTANISNIQQGPPMFHKNESEGNPWIRISYWKNGSKKGTKTVWVFKKYLTEYLQSHEIREGCWSYVRQQQNRKIAPATYMKARLPKGFFDYFIADEAHLYKGGSSAQGNAFHTLIKLSKKQIVLTGTIMGGVASDLFYLLFRLAPKKLLDRGYKYTDVMKFAADYGVIETEYQFDSKDEYYNTSSKGMKKGEPNVRPGISPLIFAHFLFENTLFMDLSELSAFLPKFSEHTIRVDMTSKQSACYGQIQAFFKSIMFEKGGRKLLPTMTQTLLSWPDKLTGYDYVRHPDTGAIRYTIPSLETKNEIYPKEQALVDLINQEYNVENRMCFVFTTFTGEKGDKDIMPRLKEVIEKHCNLLGKVAILRANTVKPIDRELWIKNATAKGIKIVICNPRIVETGLDLLDHPTLIFYQTGYSLFTLWQASRRGYRLNQNKECRVFYLAYKRTLQDDCLKIMAEKKVATAAIQGQFTSEGLAAMAQGVNTQVALAQALAEGSKVTDNGMEEMFAKINEANTSYEISEEDALFLKELKELELNQTESIGEHIDSQETLGIINNAISIGKVFDLFKNISIGKKNKNVTESEENISQEDFFIISADSIKSKKKSKIMKDQLGFF